MPTSLRLRLGRGGEPGALLLSTTRTSVASLLLASCALAQQITLSNIHGDGQVLQSSTPLLVGFAAPGVLVTATVAASGDKASATSDAAGRFVIGLPPQAPGLAPTDIAFASADGAAAALRGVLFGDVFLCVGEGALAMTVASAFNASAEMERANLYGAGVRLFAAAPAAADLPQPQLTAAPMLPWQPASATAVSGKNWTHFSSSCWTLGRELFDALGGSVPIGLVQSTYGGAPFSAFFPTMGYPNVTGVCGAAPAPPVGAPELGTVANAMLYPWFPQLEVAGKPYSAFRGTVWGAGESTVPPQGTDADVDWYRCAWMLDAAPVGLPNVWAQLGPVIAPMWTDAAARLRDAQRDGVVGNEANEACIGTADLGDVTSPFTTPYFRDQITVGKRFAAAMLNLAYGHSSPAYIGPLATSAVAASSNTSAVATVTVSFSPQSVASGLVYAKAACPPGLPQDDPNDGWGASSCIGWRVQSGYAAFPPTPVYTPQVPGGFIGAGNDLPGSGQMTVAQAEAACTANLQCVGFTFQSPDVNCNGAACNIYLKSDATFTRADGWQTYNSSRAPVGRWYNADSVAVSADGKSAVVTATLPNIGDSVQRVQYGYGPWPLHSLSNGAGLPALPFMLPVSQSAADPEGEGAAPRGRGRRLQLQPWLALKPLAFVPLPLTSVMPAGWLKAQLDLAVNGMSGWLHTFYGPVMLSPWISNCSVPCQDTNEGEDCESINQCARRSSDLSAPPPSPPLTNFTVTPPPPPTSRVLVRRGCAARAPLAERAAAGRPAGLRRAHPRDAGSLWLARAAQLLLGREWGMGQMACARGPAALARGDGRRAPPARRARASARELPAPLNRRAARRQLGRIPLGGLRVPHRVVP